MRLSPKVTNNIAQGKAVSAATLGNGYQKLRSLKGSNVRPGLRSLFVQFCDTKCFLKISWDKAKNDCNSMRCKDLFVPLTRGTSVGQDGTKSRIAQAERSIHQLPNAKRI